MLEGKTIMVVEDEALVALDLALTVEDAGAEVAGPCYRLSSALDMARRTEIDGAVLDVDLHGETVLPLAHDLQDRGVPFIFHTGRADLAALARDFPRAPICVKPSSPERLLDCLRNALAGGADASAAE